MHCVACDDPLTPKEMGRKSPITGEDYLLCTPCLEAAGLLQQAIEIPIADDSLGGASEYLDTEIALDSPEDFE
jgi:hypothetical protein